MNYRKGVRVSTALLLLFLSIIAGLYLLERKEEEPPQKMEETQIIDIHVGEIAAVAVSHGDVRYGLIHRSPDIIMEPPVEGEDPSREEMQAFIYRLSKLRAIGEVTRKESLQAYGLDSPRALITLMLKEGEKIRLALGKENPVNGSSYVAKEGEESLYMISKNDAELFMREPKDFRSRTILPKIESRELDRIGEVSLEFESKELEDFTIRNTSGTKFKLSEPFEYSLDHQSVLSEMIFPLLALNPDAAMDEGEAPELEDRPGFVLKIVIDQKPYALSFEEGESAYYIRGDDLSRVYEISKEAVPWGDLQYRDLMKDEVYHINVSDVDRMLIAYDGEEHDITLSGQATALTGELQGKKLEHPEFMDLFNALFRTGIAGVVHGTPPEELGKNTEPLLRFQIYKKDGSIDELEYFTKNESEAYVSVNGDVKLSTYSARIEKLKRTIRDAIETEE
ncbi:MAG: DUF4340 domain-containing protein [Spirochaetaceae bacterium]